jgi:ABC-type Fe3+-hydroxamate transport system substrate-binding protein
MPGSHIPILNPDKIVETNPDYVIILPWNIKKEIKDQLKDVLDSNTKYVTMIPTLEESS